MLLVLPKFEHTNGACAIAEHASYAKRVAQSYDENIVAGVTTPKSQRAAGPDRGGTAAISQRCVLSNTRESKGLCPHTQHTAWYWWVRLVPVQKTPFDVLEYADDTS